MRVYRGGGGGGTAFDAGSSSCCLFFFFFFLSFSFSPLHLAVPASRGRLQREVPSQMVPSDLHKAVLLSTHTGARWPPLIKRARSLAYHAHAYPLLRAQRTSAHRGDTEAPRMPCCANNTTAHVRDISFYYYPLSALCPFSPSFPSNPTSATLLFATPSLPTPSPFPLFLDLAVLPPFLRRYYFSSSSPRMSFCHPTAKVS